MTWVTQAESDLAAIAAEARLRRVVDFDARGPVGVFGGAPVVSFASNDYLGLSAHPALVAAAHEALDRWGAGAGAARLIVGSRPVHSQLETALAEWKRCERALLFPTGFAANYGVLTTLGGSGVLICSDELNHASIIDGCRAARARVAVYPHGDARAVDDLLKVHDGPAIVVTDTVFSMDGDVAPVDALAEICRRHGALLVLDEAHAVLGPDPGLQHVDHLRIGTLSKFLGAMGGFVAGPASLIDVLVNTCRPFIFTTGSSPADAAAALKGLDIYTSAEGDVLRARLRRAIEVIAPGHPSPIVPVVIGAESSALQCAARLLDRGLLVPAIRPPSVPTGTSRLRVTLSAAHTNEHIHTLAGALAELVGERVGG